MGRAVEMSLLTSILDDILILPNYSRLLIIILHSRHSLTLDSIHTSLIVLPVPLSHFMLVLPATEIWDKRHVTSASNFETSYWLSGGCFTWSDPIILQLCHIKFSASSPCLRTGSKLSHLERPFKNLKNWMLMAYLLPICSIHLIHRQLDSSEFSEKVKLVRWLSILTLLLYVQHTIE